MLKLVYANEIRHDMPNAKFIWDENWI